MRYLHPFLRPGFAVSVTSFFRSAIIRSAIFIFITMSGASHLVHAAELGDLVFADLDGDGVQEAGDTGLGNITIELYNCDGVLLDSTVSANDGRYGFGGLAAGSYRLRVIVPTGYRLSPAGRDRWSLDSDFDPVSGFASCRQVAANDVRNGIDAGLVSLQGPTSDSAAIGDLIWEDSNGDGIKDDDERGYAGAEIELARCDGTFIRSTFSDVNGEYLFDRLASGGYQIRVVIPSGYRISPIHATHWSMDSDFGTDGVAYCKSVDTGQIRKSVDAGLIPASTAALPTARIGNRVWLDSNADGIFAAGEPGLEGINVQLQSCDGTTLRETTTDSNGIYEFNGLLEGSYRLHLDLANSAVLSPAAQPIPANFEPGERLDGIVPGSWLLDSDFNPETNSTACIPLADGQLRYSIDAGVIDQGRTSAPPEISVVVPVVTESDSSAVVKVQLSTPSDQPINVNVATRSATATTGRDFSGRFAALRFEPGTTSLDFPIAILNDTLFEADEYLEVRLWAATNAQIAQEITALTITDDDPATTGPSRLSVAPTTIREGDDEVANIVVTLSPPATQTVTVSVSTVANTAQAGLDYYGLLRRLSFAPGEAIKTVPVIIVDDSTPEEPENLNARLFRAEGATLDIGRAAIKILDND